MELDQLELLKGREIKVCFNLDARILLPQIYRRASLLTYPSGDQQATWTSSVNIERALQVRAGLMRFWLLWIASPALIWLVVRYGLQAWREMTRYSRR